MPLETVPNHRAGGPAIGRKAPPEPGGRVFFQMQLDHLSDGQADGLVEEGFVDVKHEPLQQINYMRPATATRSVLLGG